jgi:hypothetical protein
MSSWRRHVILKTAAALDLTVPPSLLQNEVIEREQIFPNLMSGNSSGALPTEGKKQT